MTRTAGFASLALVAMALAALVPMNAAFAQYGPDDGVTGGNGDGGYGAPAGGREGGRARGRQGERTRQRPRIDPYIEVSQIVFAQLSPGDDVVTYTQLAAGVDASIQGRNNGLAASVRVEKNIGYGGNSVDSESISGIARGYAGVVPDALSVEAGALAAQTRFDGAGGAALNPVAGANDDRETRIYSLYAGPRLATRAGPAEVSGQYRFGYNRVEAPGSPVVPVGGAPGFADLFDESTTHSASLRVGVPPRRIAPVGMAASSGFFQEDTDILDQRVRDFYARADVTVPLTDSVAALGGVGYEDVEVSSRDALRDPATGAPVIGGDGRYLTDEASPRRIAFDTDGLIWDVGVLWRPSRRTDLEAHYGRRYGSETYYGSFAYRPDRRSSLNVAVYDTLSGFGGLLGDTLAGFSTDFTVDRNPLSGDLTGCVTSVEGGGGCLGGALSSLRGAVFRARGVGANYSRQLGRMTAGIGAGYNRRKFIAAPGTVLARVNGVVDESYYINAGLSGPIGREARFAVNAYGQVLDAGGGDFGDATILGASAAYQRYLLAGLSARAALGIDHVDSRVTELDQTAASALVGLRYDF